MSQMSDMLLKAKRAIIHKREVRYRGAVYIPVKLVWFQEKGEDRYSVRLIDPTAKSSCVEAPIQDVEFERS